MLPFRKKSPHAQIYPDNRPEIEHIYKERDDVSYSPDALSEKKINFLNTFRPSTESPLARSPAIRTLSEKPEVEYKFSVGDIVQCKDKKNKRFDDFEVDRIEPKLGENGMYFYHKLPDGEKDVAPVGYFEKRCEPINKGGRRQKKRKTANKKNRKNKRRTHRR